MKQANLIANSDSDQQAEYITDEGDTPVVLPSDERERPLCTRQLQEHMRESPERALHVEYHAGEGHLCARQLQVTCDPLPF